MTVCRVFGAGERPDLLNLCIAVGTGRLECGRGDWNSWCGGGGMRGYQEETPNGEGRSHFNDAEKRAWGANRIRYPVVHAPVNVGH